MGTPKKIGVEKNVVKAELAGDITLITFTVDDDPTVRFRAEGVLVTNDPPLSKSERSHRLAGTAGGFQYTEEQLGINLQVISGVSRPAVILGKS